MKLETLNDNNIINHLKKAFERFSKLNSKINSDILSTISDIDNSDILSDTIVNHIVFSIEEKQSFLEMTDPLSRENFKRPNSSGLCLRQPIFKPKDLRVKLEFPLLAKT